MDDWTEEEKKAYAKYFEKWHQEEAEEIAIFKEACTRFNETPDEGGAE